MKMFPLLAVAFAVAVSSGIVSSEALAQSSEKPAAQTAKPRKEPTPAQLATRKRQTACAAEWRSDKAAGKISQGQKWPQYWSACNKRLKAASL